MKKILCLLWLTALVYNANAQGTGCVSGNCKNGNGRYIWNTGDSYEGEWSNGQPNGLGAYVFANGMKYVGQCRNNVREGLGIFQWNNGNIYAGEWKNGNQDGYGIYIYSSGTKDEGYWKNGSFQYKATPTEGCYSGNCTDGYGMYVFKSGEKYIGIWGKNMRNGVGINFFKDGEIFIGPWKDEKRNGLGFNIYTDKTTKIGYWSDNTFQNLIAGGGSNNIASTGCTSGDCTDGFGIYTWSSGEKYEGNWKNGKRNGQGTNTWADGDSYNGAWIDDKREGYGTSTYANGSPSKTGYWKNDKYVGSSSSNNYQSTGCVSGNCKDGYGTYLLNTGDKYIGYFKAGQYSGQGTYTFVTGYKYDGEWANSMYNGYGTLLSPDGTKQTGYWKNNTFTGSSSSQKGCISGNCTNGYGTYSFEGGDRYDGNFTSGTFSGQGTYIFASDGRKYVGEWLSGKYNGFGTMFYADGTSKAGYWKDNNYLGASQSNTNVVVNNAGNLPAITWISPDAGSTNVSTASTNIKACVKSESDIKSVKIYLNGELVSSTNRGYKVVTAGCDCSIDQDLKLGNGNNEIKIIVENSAGTTTSDIRNLIFNVENNNTSNEVRYALVIGNSNYASSPLRNPANDATAMAASLKALGFDVTLSTDASYADMLKLIREFGTKLTNDKKSIGLFYYAGHGMQLNGENYLIPVTARIEKEQDVELEAVALKRVLGEMDYASNQMNIIILDACRNNPFARSFRSGGNSGLATTNAPQGTFIAYATSPGSVAADGTGNNGLYTEELLKALNKPGVKIEDVFKQVRASVYNLSNKQQVPWENSSIFGDFYFKR